MTSQDPTPLHIDEKTLNLPVDFAELFGREAPLAIEIGTGNGFFIENEAAAHPDINFLGIEREKEFYWKMVRRCHRRGLTNVRTTHVDAHEVLAHWTPPRSVDRVYLLFTDPWPKRRHAGRRVFNATFLPMLERVLKPTGELRFKTDVPWLFNLTVTALRRHGGWELLTVGRNALSDPALGQVISNYERKARERGAQIWGFIARPMPGTIKD